MAWNNLTVPTDDAEEFQRILDAAYKNYQDSIENLTDAATDEIETALTRGDMALKEIVREYVTDASQLAKDYHHLLRQAWSEYSGTEFPPFSDDGLVDFDRVLWQTVHGVANTDYPGLKFRDVKSGSNKFGVTMDDLWPSMANIDDAQQFIGDMIAAATRAQTQRSIRRDPTKPRWARVPQGKSCAFCTMLAGRGFAYTSEEAAGGDGNTYHDHCHCRVIPSWGKQTLTGYDPKHYASMYDGTKDAAGKGASYRERLRLMRRAYPDELRDGVHETQTHKWEYDWIDIDDDELDRLKDFHMRTSNDRYTAEKKIDKLRYWTTDDGCAAINSALFGNNAKSVQGVIDVIDEALHDHATKTAFTVDRLMDPRYFGLTSAAQLPQIEIGYTSQHLGYVATTIKKGGIKATSGDKILTRILVPPGTHAAYLADISAFPGEKEILLPRDSEFEVVSIGRTDAGLPCVFLKMVE